MNTEVFYEEANSGPNSGPNMSEEVNGGPNSGPNSGPNMSEEVNGGPNSGPNMSEEASKGLRVSEGLNEQHNISNMLNSIESNLCVVTWNVNGIRSRIFNNKISSQLKKNSTFTPEVNSCIYNLVNQYNPDIICLQETRCDETNGSLFIIDGYHNYFNSSKLTDARGPNRYSGTAIYTKNKPNRIEYTVPDYNDMEGRIMIAYYNEFIIINVYSPNSGTNYNNKILFQDALYNYVKQLELDFPGTKIIYCGDFNIAIDTHFDKTTAPPVPGTYKHELEYYSRLLKIGFKDSISKNDKTVYTWWDQRSKRITVPETNKDTNLLRHQNKGWRIDYIFTKNFKYSESCVLKHIGEEWCPHGSDHAPVCAKILNQ